MTWGQLSARELPLHLLLPHALERRPPRHLPIVHHLLEPPCGPRPQIEHAPACTDWFDARCAIVGVRLDVKTRRKFAADVNFARRLELDELGRCSFTGDRARCALLAPIGHDQDARAPPLRACTTRSPQRHIEARGHTHVCEDIGQHLTTVTCVHHTVLPARYAQLPGHAREVDPVRN